MRTPNWIAAIFKQIEKVELVIVELFVGAAIVLGSLFLADVGMRLWYGGMNVGIVNDRGFYVKVVFFALSVQLWIAYIWIRRHILKTRKDMEKSVRGFAESIDFAQMIEIVVRQGTDERRLEFRLSRIGLSLQLVKAHVGECLGLTGPPVDMVVEPEVWNQTLDGQRNDLVVTLFPMCRDPIPKDGGDSVAIQA